MELTKEQIRKMTLEEAKRIIEENGYETSGQLYKGCKQLYNWLYRNGLLKNVYVGYKTIYTPHKYDTKSKPRNYDVTKVLPYLERWAEESDTTIKEQAGKYGYSKLWIEWCRENGVDINTKTLGNE